MSTMEEDEGFSSSKLTGKKSSPLSGLKVSPGEDYSYDSKSKGFKGATVGELYAHAINESQAVTSSVQESVELSREMKNIAQGTLVELDRQGEKIQNIQTNIFHIDQVLEKGLKIMNKLGNCFQTAVGFIFKNKNSDDDDDDGHSDLATPQKIIKAQKGLNHFNWNVKEKVVTGVTITDNDGSAAHPEMKKLMEERDMQDDMLDEVSENMSMLKSMVVSMGESIESQSSALQTLSSGFDKVNAKTDALTGKGSALL